MKKVKDNDPALISSENSLKEEPSMAALRAQM